LTNHVNSTENNHPQWYGFIAPIVFSILGVIAWLVFILLYALYWSKSFSLFQNIILTIVSLAITGLLIGLMWVIWGTMYHRRSMQWQNQWSAWLTLVSADA
jgi:phosphoglycerol transferase MdoB-like AlkP superfamily enzyme